MATRRSRSRGAPAPSRTTHGARAPRLLEVTSTTRLDNSAIGYHFLFPSAGISPKPPPLRGTSPASQATCHVLRTVEPPDVRQRQRRCILQPRVARCALPWDLSKNMPNPERVLSFAGRINATPSGLGHFISDPRVARASQPWAGRRSTFGAREPVAQGDCGNRIAKGRNLTHSPDSNGTKITPISRVEARRGCSKNRLT